MYLGYKNIFETIQDYISTIVGGNQYPSQDDIYRLKHLIELKKTYLNPRASCISTVQSEAWSDFVKHPTGCAMVNEAITYNKATCVEVNKYLNYFFCLFI